jgi:hypothetical protein
MGCGSGIMDQVVERGIKDKREGFESQTKESSRKSRLKMGIRQ